MPSAMMLASGVSAAPAGRLSSLRSARHLGRGSLGIAARAPARAAVRIGIFAAVSEGKTYDGPVLLHLQENCKSSPVFPEFLEGLYHVTEVARNHPTYQSTMIHQSYDDELAAENEDFSYFTVGVYGEVEGGPAGLLAKHEVMADALEFGVEAPAHVFPATEVATLSASGESPLAPGGVVQCPEERVVLLSMFALGEAGDEADWQDWSGAKALSEKDGFLSSTLYRCEGPVETYQYALRTEMEQMEAFSAEACRAEHEAASSAGFTRLYKAIFSVPKEGLPTGLYSAQRDKEMVEKAGAGGEGVVDVEAQAAAGADLLDGLESELKDEM